MGVIECVLRRDYEKGVWVCAQTLMVSWSRGDERNGAAEYAAHSLFHGMRQQVKISGTVGDLKCVRNKCERGQGEQQVCGGACGVCVQRYTL